MNDDEVFYTFQTFLIESNTDDDGVTRKIEIDIGCSGKYHAIQVIESFYVNGEVEHAEILDNLKIGKCDLNHEQPSKNDWFILF